MKEENENDISPKNSLTLNTKKDLNNLETQEEDVITIQKNRKKIINNNGFFEKNLIKKASGFIDENDPDFQEINDTFDIDNDFLLKEGCTALTLGLEPMPQKCYICLICEKDHYLCNYCYLYCHEKCRNFEGRDSPKSLEENNYLGEKEFACYCGNKLKHKIYKIPKVLIMPCSMTQLDDTLGISLFFCKNHNITICAVCSVECHKKCKVIKYKERNNEMPLCKCTNEKHTIYNDVGIMFNLDEYKKITNAKIWSVQVLNILFSHKNNFENLINLFSSVLSSKDVGKEKNEKLYFLLGLFTNKFDRKFKTFYFHEDIIKMLKFDNLIQYIQNINLSDAKSVILKFRLFFVLLFIHFKRDFQMVKCFTSIDFVSKTILERIEYKKILMKPSIYTSIIDKKYDLKTIFKENNVLKMIVIEDICNLIEFGLDYLNLKENRIEFEFGLKYVCFMVKKMIFTKKDIKKLIKSIYPFFNKFYEFIQSDLENNLYPLLDIFNTLIELLFMFTVSYNDLTVMEYLDKNKNVIKIVNIEQLEDFIHSKSEHGSMIFKILLRSCDIFKIHYELIEKEDKTKEINEDYIEKIREKKLKRKIIENKIKNTDIKLPQNGGLFSEKITILFIQTLNMFCIANNVYFEQIKSITKDDLNEYYQYMDKINNNIDWDYFTIKQKNDLTENLYNLKIGIETELNTLFLSCYSNDSINISKRLYKKIQFFSDKLNSIIKETNKIQNNNQAQYNINPDNDIINNDINEEEEEEKNKAIFLDKIAENNYSNYLYITNEKFRDASENIVDMLIISSLDESLGKVLVMFSNRNYPNLLTYELVDIIFSTWSLYFHSRRGTKFFLLGKNLTRLNKVLNRFESKPNNKNIEPELGKTIKNNIDITRRVLDFLIDVTSALKFYNLTMKSHKVLKRITKNLLIHLSSMSKIAKRENIENEFLFHFSKVLKIFYKLSDNFDQEELTLIKYQILSFNNENDLNIFSNDSFKNIFNSYNYIEEQNKDKSNKRSQFQEYIKKIDWKNKIGPTNMGKRRLYIDLYFDFFNLMGEKPFYTFISKNNFDLYDALFKFNDLEEFQRCFRMNLFNLNQKVILLKYIRGIYLLDRLDQYDILSQQRYLTTEEYIYLLRNQFINEPNIIDSISFPDNLEITKKNEGEIKKKYFLINQINILLQIYLRELKQFPRQFIKVPLEYCKPFLEELILGIKYVTNFFYFQKDLWPKMQITFYEICQEFLLKIAALKAVYDDINNSEEDIYTFAESDYDEDNVKTNSKEKEEIKEILAQMNSVNFNIFDINKLYRFITEQMNNILKYTKLNTNIGLQSYLEVYDTMAEANFNPFSLVETLDYEYFYEEDQKKDEALILKDIKLYTLKNIADTFLNTFVDLNNTTFMDTLTSYSEESLIYNYREKFLFFFNAFLNSIEGNNATRLEILICIITRMCFYDSSNMQEQFENFIYDPNFFPNLNKLINYYIVLSFSVTKNIFAYKYAERVSNITKLLIQFAQAFGEGFNKTYHDNIFKFQNQIKERENEEEKSEIKLNKGLEPTSLESSFENNIINDNNILENININIIDSDEEKKHKKNNNARNELEFMEDLLDLKTSVPDVKITRTIYESVIINLKRALFLLDLNNAIDSDMPYDKLIILITNLIDFLIEYIETEDDKEKIIHNGMIQLCFGSKENQNNVDSSYNLIDNKSCIDILFMRIKEEQNNKLYLLRKKVLCYVKNKFIQLLIYYLLPGNKKFFVEHLINKKCSPIELYLEILYHFNDLLKHLDLKNPGLVLALKSCTFL